MRSEDSGDGFARQVLGVVAAAIGVSLAQRDGRYYALVTLVVLLCGLRTGMHATGRIWS